MPGTLVQKLSGMRVVGTEGSEIGTVYNITVDMERGTLESLLVDPDPEYKDNVNRFEMDEGKVVVPIHLVEAAKDNLLISE